MYYESYFGLTEPPFSISPDPRYLYLTAGHREALAHLLYGVSGGGGFVLLTGEVGSGKTTVCRCLLQQLPEDVDVALVLNPKLGPLEFLEAICDELKIEIYGEHPITLKWLVDHLYNYLLAAHGKGRNTVLIVDEAQNLSPEVIEHLRLLTNLETDEKKLLQIILIGQPELRDLIASPALRQMAQRVTARFHLDLLSKSDARAYVEHRLKVASCERPLFDRRAISYIWKKSNGVPRLMNAICDRALLGVSIANQQTVSFATAKKAAAEVLGNQVSGARSRRRSAFFLPLAASLVFIVLLVALVFRLMPTDWPLPRLSDFSAVFGIASDATNNPLDGKQKPGRAKTANGLAAGEEAVHAPEVAPFAEGQSQMEEDGSAASTGLHADDRGAYTRLYQLWGLDRVSQDTRSDCKHVESFGLRCYFGKGTTPRTLELLNRPAVLTLRGDEHENTSAVLLSLNDERALVYAHGNEQMLPVDELNRVWTGDYLLLWRVPSAYTRVVRQGDRGEMVTLISKRLSLENSESISVFDELVARRVRAFQQIYGLVPDGQVGPLTMIALNNFSGVAAPGLRDMSDAAATAARE